MVTLYQAIGKYFANKTEEHYKKNQSDFAMIQGKVRKVLDSEEGRLILTGLTEESLKNQYSIAGLTRRAKNVWEYRAGESLMVPDSKIEVSDSRFKDIVNGLQEVINSISAGTEKFKARDMAVKKLQDRLVKEGKTQLSAYLIGESVRAEMPAQVDYLDHVKAISDTLGASFEKGIMEGMKSAAIKTLSQVLGGKIRGLEGTIGMLRAEHVDLPIIYGE